MAGSQAARQAVSHLVNIFLIAYCHLWSVMVLGFQQKPLALLLLVSECDSSFIFAQRVVFFVVCCLFMLKFSVIKVLFNLKICENKYINICPARKAFSSCLLNFALQGFLAVS